MNQVSKTSPVKAEEMINEINAALLALVSMHAGATEPVPTYPYMFWPDTGNGLLKQRNGANDDWVVVGKLNKAYWGITETISQVDVCQTVLTGRMDATTRIANYLSAGTGRAINIAATAVNVRDTVAYGFDSSGNKVDILLPPITADLASAWASLPANQSAASPIYLYRGLTDAGAVEYGYTLLAPYYDDFAPSTPAVDQYWYDIQSRFMKRWTGTAWEIKKRVFHGECTTDSSSVTSVKTYALKGKYDSGWYAVAANGQYELPANLGVNQEQIKIGNKFRKSSSYTPADLMFMDTTNTPDYSGCVIGATSRNNVRVKVAENYVCPFYFSQAGSTDTRVASGEYRTYAERRF